MTKSFFVFFQKSRCFKKKNSLFSIFLRKKYCKSDCFMIPLLYKDRLKMASIEKDFLKLYLVENYQDFLEERSNPCVSDCLESLRVFSMTTFNHSIDFFNKLIRYQKPLNLSDKELKTVCTAALIHDIGKIYLKPSWLTKKGLTREQIRKYIGRPHIECTQQFLTPYLQKGYISQQVFDLAINHHEKLNGTGYLKQLRGKQLSKLDRIIAVVDILSAISNHREYRDQDLTPIQCVDILCYGAVKGELDKQVVKIVSTEFAKDTKIKNFDINERFSVAKQRYEKEQSNQKSA